MHTFRIMWQHHDKVPGLRGRGADISPAAFHLFRSARSVFDSGSTSAALGNFDAQKH